MKDTSQLVKVSGFLGVPRAADPAPEGIASTPRRALIAPEHDPEVERAYAFAWDDFTRKRPDVGFLIELVGGDDAAARAAVRAALAPEAPLRLLRVVLVGAATDTDLTPPARRPARLADRVIGFLQGDDVGIDLAQH